MSAQIGVGKQVKAFDDQILRLEKSAADLGARLQKQFTALDQTMSRLQSQMSYINALFYR